ncbi:hypothetical protein LCGC14_0305820 [marine sediment metagenome]|uniref:Phage portal protein n=1 Tax=marine sediment metagenome TaxID=412755 RepID=A0A0F9WV36_9ZZZZ
MGRQKGSTNKKLPTRGSTTSKRLYKQQQVRESKVKMTGFGIKEVYVPYENLGSTEVRTLVLSCAWIDNCINTIIDEVVKYPLTSKDKKIQAFLSYPSLVEPLFTIRKKYLKDMLRYGNGACMVKYRKDKPYELRIIPGYTVKVDDSNPPKYPLTKIDSSSPLQDKSGKEIKLQNKECLLFQIDADSDRTLAISPLKRIYNMVRAEKNLTKALQQFTNRGFFLPSFISMEKTNGTEIKEFVEYLNNIALEGAKMFGVNKKATVTAIPYWSAEDIIKINKWLALYIANAYKVPPFMLNLVENTGSLNAREQRSRFLENVVLPILEYESYIYTMKIARQGFQTSSTITAPTMSIKLSFNKVRAAAIAIGSDEALMSVDEARKWFLNLEPKKKERLAKDK